MTLSLCSICLGLKITESSEFPVGKEMSCFRGALAQGSKYSDRHCTDSSFHLHIPPSIALEASSNSHSDDSIVFDQATGGFPH